MTSQVVSQGSKGPRKRWWSRGGAHATGVALVVLLVTGSGASTAQAQSVPLGTAASFAVLAGSTVTNTGPSVISGDLGVSPGSAVTGFPPGTVTEGTIHAADGVATQAQADLTTAYNNAAGRPSTATISADLAGSTLTPGVYTSATSLGLSGDLTLNAEGDPNAVFVFQAGSTLTVGSGSRVLLIGGAQACNVFWQVGSSATVGSASVFAGNILALTSISMTTGATLHGRALARNGAVTLDTNRITRAACSTATPAPPSVSNTSATTGAGESVTVQLNGTDATGAPLTYSIVGAPSHGTLGPIDQAAGTVTYTPTPGYTGPDSFTYQAVSTNGTSGVATGNLTVTPTGTGGGGTPGGGNTGNDTGGGNTGNDTGGGNTGNDTGGGNTGDDTGGGRTTGGGDTDTGDTGGGTGGATLAITGVPLAPLGGIGGLFAATGIALRRRLRRRD
jgi:hypothetical protein